MKNDIVYIYGWGASGKSTLLRLLDGHPELGVMPFHDTIINTFALPDHSGEFRDSANPTKLDIRTFRRYSAQSKYYLAQRMHEGLKARQEPAAEDSTAFLLEGFDFYDFEREWIGRVNESGDLSIQNILDTIFLTFFETWDKYDFDNDVAKYYVGTGCIRNYPMRFLMENFEESKIIFVRRDPRGILATDGSRPATDYDVTDLLRRGEIYKINSQYKYALDLAEEHPDRMEFVDFEELVLEAPSVIDDVVEFLDIRYDDILQTPTFCGESIQTETGANYIGEINDDWTEIFSEAEKQLANLQIEETPLYGTSPRMAYLYLRSRLVWNATKARSRLAEVVG